MKEYSDYLMELNEKTDALLTKITKYCKTLGRQINIMHVCGTHEATVSRAGIRSLLPKNLRIISGPGCPVCICPAEHITTAKELAKRGNIITTFGDMFKVPDTTLKSLSHLKAEGHDIRTVYSAMDAVKIAEKNPDKRVIWLGVGFETTAPMTAYELMKKPPSNFYVLADFRLVPPALDLLLSDPEHELTGIILPGHVTTVMGLEEYEEFPRRYGIPMTVAGFEAVEFLYALEVLLKMMVDGELGLKNSYTKVVRYEGNPKAKEVMKKVFKVVDAKWRGIGTVKQSGYDLNEDFGEYNARNLIDFDISLEYDLPKGCRCGGVILGKVEPEECPHFLRRCTPETAIGPCMVSDEGTCRIRATFREVR